MKVIFAARQHGKIRGMYGRGSVLVNVSRAIELPLERIKSDAGFLKWFQEHVSKKDGEFYVHNAETFGKKRFEVLGHFIVADDKLVWQKKKFRRVWQAIHSKHSSFDG